VKRGVSISRGVLDFSTATPFQDFGGCCEFPRSFLGFFWESRLVGLCCGVERRLYSARSFLATLSPRLLTECFQGMVLTIVLRSAQKLPAGDWNGKSDPFVVLHQGTLDPAKKKGGKFEKVEGIGERGGGEEQD
jgi:hypothetical protein